MEDETGVKKLEDCEGGEEVFKKWIRKDTVWKKIRLG